MILLKYIIFFFFLLIPQHSNNSYVVSKHKLKNPIKKVFVIKDTNKYEHWNDSIYILVDFKIKNSIIDSAMNMWKWKRYKIIDPTINTKKTPNVLIMFVDSIEGNPFFEFYLGITSNTYDTTDNTIIKKSIIYLNENKIYSFDQMKETIFHEIGHLFGIAHSLDSNDLMYYRETSIKKMHTSQSDIDSMKKHYPKLKF
jgi:predicted Zn-dependent protease